MTTPQADKVWKAVLGELQLQVPRPSYETWLKDTVGLALEDGELIVGTPNAFVAEMLEQRMYALVSQAVERVTRTDDIDIQFHVAASHGHDQDPDAVVRNGRADKNAPQANVLSFGTEYVSSNPQSIALNPKYKFDTFIVGKSNELAHAAAQAVSDRPGIVYNPLVLYSDVGLGKTHLLHAIGSHIRSHGKTLIYCTTEQFTNEYIKAIREGTTESFRDRYRSADLLLLDDIQFLIGKEQTQEGFFHTFNALHMTNRQIVITSDRPVEALTLLEDRVRSRLAGGLVVDISPPDVETRMAILRAKAEQRGLRVEDRVLAIIAERVQKNIRELEGSLNRVVALADLTGCAIDADLVKRAIADPGSSTKRRVSEGQVVAAVADYFGMDGDTIRGRKRDKRTALARQVTMYLLREEADLGASAIGRALGGKDHTTVLHGCERITNQLNIDAGLRRDIINIRETLATG
jgi:chromosomal replication initiator protein